MGRRLGRHFTFTIMRESLIAGADLAKGQIIRLDAGEFVAADAGDADATCVLLEDVASGAPVHFHPLVPGSETAVLSDGAISALAPVFQADDGRVAATGTIRRGIALTSAAGADELVDVLVC